MHRSLLVTMMLLALVGQSVASSLDLALRDVGISMGNSKRFTGIRLNGIDRNVERLRGLNLTLWRPGENPVLRVDGIGLGIVGPDGEHLRGLMGGGIGVSADRVDGLAFGLLGIGVNEMRGVAIAPLGGGFGGASGVMIGGIGVGASEINGLALGGIGVGGRKIRGIAIGGLAVGAKEITGIGAAGLIVRAERISGLSAAIYCEGIRDQKGISIALLNRTPELHGLQVGLLNYAGNNPHPFRYLPIFNFHMD